MLDLIKSLFTETEGNRQVDSPRARDLEGAAAALMIEAACLDGTFDASERETIKELLCRRFDLDEPDAEAMIEEGQRAADDSHQIYDVVRVIRDHLGPDERIEVIEMLWEVSYADGIVHEYESNLVRRIAGLLYVPDQDSGAARKRVIGRLQHQTDHGA